VTPISRFFFRPRPQRKQARYILLKVKSEQRHVYIEALRRADAHDFQPLINYLTALNPG
jgi:hypothetical protein